MHQRDLHTLLMNDATSVDIRHYNEVVHIIAEAERKLKDIRAAYFKQLAEKQEHFNAANFPGV